MDLSRENLDTLFTGFQALLNRGLEQADTSYLQWSDEVNSSTAEEIYPITVLTGSMREWIGERMIHSIDFEKMTVRNRDFELTEAIPANAVEDDQFNIYGRCFTIMGVNSGNLWGGACHRSSLQSRSMGRRKIVLCKAEIRKSGNRQLPRNGGTDH